MLHRYNIYGVEVTYWTFESVKGESLNLFADGTLSPHYLLAKCPGNSTQAEPAAAVSQ